MEHTAAVDRSQLFQRRLQKWMNVAGTCEANGRLNSGAVLEGCGNLDHGFAWAIHSTVIADHHHPTCEHGLDPQLATVAIGAAQHRIHDLLGPLCQL